VGLSASGNGGLAERVCGENGHKGINLGRDSKKALKEVRSVGNWSLMRVVFSLTRVI
jgi:hypothetical protein